MEDKLNIFNIIGEIDSRNVDFYDDLTDEEKKKFGMFTLIRWSSTPTKNNRAEIHEYYIDSMNEVSKRFFSLSKHPELQWKLLASNGIGMNIRHEWIPNIKKINTNKLDKFLLEFMPYMNKQELDIIKSRLTVDVIKDLCKKYGMIDSEIKEYVDEVKKLKK